MDNSKSRVVVVTGGSRGIGRSVVLKFAEETARIIVVHYDPDDTPADETVDLLNSMGVKAEVKRLDVSSFSDVDLFFKDVISRHETIDVLVNNAGITRDSLFMRMKETDWDTVISVNLKSVFNCTQAVIRAMSKQRKGRIVNLASVSGQMGNIGQGNYAASKAGVMGLTKTVAREVAGRGITVNAVAPGFIDTEMTAVLPEKVKQNMLLQIPAGRIGKPEEVADAIYWLCSDAASYITGQVIHVNGGMYM